MNIRISDRLKRRQRLSFLIILFFMGLFILPAVFPPQASAAVSDYRYRAPITVDPSEGAAYNMLQLTDEILQETREEIEDIRIYSGDEEIPYALVDEAELMTYQINNAVIRNQGKDIEGNLQFELLVPDGQWTTKIIFSSTEKDFIRRVKVEGSQEQKSWLTLTEDSTIFDLTAEKKARSLEVNLTATNFKFLRITVFNEGKGIFKLDSVGLFIQNQAKTAIMKEERSYQVIEKSSNKGIEEYTLDLLQAQLRSTEWEIATDAVNFNRTVEIYASKNNKDWVMLTQGEIFSYQLDKLTAKQLFLKFNTNLRYLKVRIDNQDNPALNMQAMKIKGYNPLLLFPIEKTKDLYLLWGNIHSKAPVYDLQKFKSNIDFFKTPLATLGQGAENDRYQYRDTRPWTERNAWLLQGIMAILVAVLLIVIIRNIRKISSDKE